MSRTTFPDRSPTISEELSNQESASPWLKRLFSLDDNHWSNSFTLWMSLNIADMAITWICLSRGMSEANPFLKMAITTDGAGIMLMVKISLALLIGLLVWRRASLRIKSALNLGIALVVIANCALVWRPFWSLALLQ